MLVSLIRPKHWIKNSIIPLGMLFAWNYYHTLPGLLHTLAVAAAFLMISSANYLINDILDADKDAKHDKKKHRRNLTERNREIIDFTILVLLFLSFSLITFFWTMPMLMAAALFVSGLIYNVPPIRAKDIAFIDVIVESLNNPIRFMAGWYLITPEHPPITFLLLTLLYSNFLMTGKRYAEFLYLGEQKAREYRKVFKTYGVFNLFIAMLVYALFFHQLIIHHWGARGNLVGLGFLIQMGWYLKLTMDDDSIIQKPVEIYKAPAFALYSCLLVAFSLLGLLL